MQLREHLHRLTLKDNNSSSTTMSIVALFPALSLNLASSAILMRRLREEMVDVSAAHWCAPWTSPVSQRCYLEIALMIHGRPLLPLDVDFCDRYTVSHDYGGEQTIGTESGWRVARQKCRTRHRRLMIALSLHFLRTRTNYLLASLSHSPVVVAGH